jgi:hypothetical protein
MNHLTLKALSACLLTASLMGCASVTVHRVTNADPEAAFELEGMSLNELEVEARRLCPAGYDTRRSWQSYRRMANDEVFYVRWWSKVSDTLSAPTPGRAQLAIVCKPAAAAQTAPNAASGTAPAASAP